MKRGCIESKNHWIMIYRIVQRIRSRFDFYRLSAKWLSSLCRCQQKTKNKICYSSQFQYPVVSSFQITAIKTITIFQTPKATQPKHATSFTLLISDQSRCLASPISPTSGADDSAEVLTKASYRWSISFIIQDYSLSSCPAHSSKTIWKRVRDEHQWFWRMRAYCSLWLDIIKGLSIS